VVISSTQFFSIDSLPYCWYFTDEYNRFNEKQIEFVSESARRGLDEIENFVDPMYVMIGFVVKTSKATKKNGERRTENREKNNVSKEYDNRRLNTTAGIGSTGYSISPNISFDYALQPRLLNDSKVVQEKTVTPQSSNINNCIYSSRINYPKTTKAKMENNFVSQSVCSTERFAKLKFEAVSARHESATYVNSTIRDAANTNINHSANNTMGPQGYIVEKDRVKFLNNTLDVNRLAATEGDFSLDTLEHLPSHNMNHKMVASMNDSQEFSVKLLETSVDNSVINHSKLVNPYNHLEISTGNEVSPFRGGSLNHSKIDSVVTSVSTKHADKQEKVQSVRNKHLELDKKYISNTFRDKNAYPHSASTTPKSSLLTKILKEKPLSKEINYASKIKAKQEQVKRLNVTAAASSSISGISGSKHISPKYSTHTTKAKVYNKFETDSNNRKYAFHNSLMKSIDVSDLSHHMGLIEERDELSKENYQHDVSERVQTAQYQNKNTRSYQSPAVFKTIISSATPRTPVDYFKTTISQNAKILNARKSHDTSYLFNAMRDTGRRNTEASIPLQTCKNKHAESKITYGKACITEFSPEPSRPMTPKLYYK